MEILKTLRDKAFTITKSFKYDGYQRGLASMVYKFFDKKSASFLYKSVASIGGNMYANKSAFNNEKLAEELHKPMIRKF